MDASQIPENPHWAEFKSKVKAKLKDDIKQKGFDKATDQHFGAFCTTFQEAIRKNLEKSGLSESAKSKLLADLFVWFFDEVMK